MCIDFSYLQGITNLPQLPSATVWQTHADNLLSWEKLTKYLQQTSDKFRRIWVPFGISLKELHVTLSWHIATQTSKWATGEKFPEIFLNLSYPPTVYVKNISHASIV